MEFEWDENKNLINKAKHGISFEAARAVFADLDVILDQDRHENGEERWQATGLVGFLRVVVVAHTYRGENNGDEIIRIISARSASAAERRRYERARMD